MLVDYIEAEISVTSKVLLKEHIQPVADAGNWFWMHSKASEIAEIEGHVSVWFVVGFGNVLWWYINIYKLAFLLFGWSPMAM